ncbi:FHA domain-containing protein [Daejeonella oryzae]|uniref:hypothetical protein n=1 Tax=Daejeonella oryzae TaxID=1122943 RepID=UPI0004042D53|nr:hypothetical protein [Daejeonella oryzae]
MFNIFNTQANNSTPDVKNIRELFLCFIKEQLQKVEGGEGSHIRGLHLFISCSDDERHLYESALYVENPGRFKTEVQKIADDYAIDLPENWMMEFTFSENIPAEALQIDGLNSALFIKTSKHVLHRTAEAYIRILHGEAEKNEYPINSESGKITIGRGKKVLANDGFFRVNKIAFPDEANHDANKYISRSHAHIIWNNDIACFMIYGDEGGIPPRNKIKIRSAANDALIKLNSVKIGYQLGEGDQVILGESAVIEFSYLKEQE